MCYMNVHVCMYVFVHVCTCDVNVCTCVYAHVCVSVCIHAPKRVCAGTCVYVCVCVHLCKYAHMSVSVSANIIHTSILHSFILRIYTPLSPTP